MEADEIVQKKKYNTSKNLTRSNGQVAFSAQGRGIADQRTSAKLGGRIAKKLGTDDTFTDEFKSAFHPDTEHLWILERVNLEGQLDAARKTISALRKYPTDGDAQRILDEMWAPPHFREKDCVLCPIWRHERELELIRDLCARYVFPQVADQLYLVTIVFDFAENLQQLEDAVEAAHQGLTDAMTYMRKQRHGVVFAGCFEPDLKSYEDLTTEYKSRALLNELGVVANDAGGWSLTGHFLVRVPHRDVLEPWLRRKYPSSDAKWHRVQFDQIKQNKELKEHLTKIFSYAAKAPAPLFKPPSRRTKDKRRDKANALMRKMVTAFNGPSRLPGADDAFDLDAAIVQWAKFMDRMGSKMMYFARESVHAQKWYSDSEMDYIRRTDGDMNRRGEHKIEVHRDCGPHSHTTVLPHLKGRLRHLRTRPLQYDDEWVRLTDCSGININTHYHDFDTWTLRPADRGS